MFRVLKALCCAAFGHRYETEAQGASVFGVFTQYRCARCGASHRKWRDDGIDA